MVAGAETNPLCVVGDVRLARVVFFAKLIDIDQEILWSGLTANGWLVMGSPR